MSETTDKQKNAPLEESFEPKVVNEFESEPRGEARIEGIDVASVDARLTDCADFFSKHCDETDYRNLEWYLQRSQLRFAVGDDIFDVIDDMFMAARCLHDRSAMHLELKPPEMFMTRRIMPVELGIISGMPMLTLEFSATFGLPLMMVLGKTAPENIMSEANLMTSFFRRGFMADFYELAGLCAVIYAGVIAAIGRGFDDEATVALSTYAKARDSLRGNPPASILPKIRRYDCLNTALACLCNGNFDMIGEVLAPVAEWFEEDSKKKHGEAFLAPSQYPVPKYYDTSILTILALAALRGKVIELPGTGAIAKYNIFTKGLMEMPERRIEVPGLDEEARQILEQAGVDPDQLSNGYVDNSFHDAKEESERRADELFQEKQREVQRAVREKLARDRDQEEDHLAVEPQKFVHEALKMRDDSVESAGRTFDFSDVDDDAARRANEESETRTEDETKPTKDYSTFFDHDDETRPAFEDTTYDVNAQPNDDTEKPQKDFSSFFNSDDEEDASIREHVEAETVGEEKKPETGKSFSNFFDNDEDEEDTSVRAHIEAETVCPEDEPERGKNFSNFFDNLDEAAIPKYDDGSEDDEVTKDHSRTFSGDFFSEDRKPSALKMTLDEDEKKDEALVENVETKPVAPVKSLYEQAREASRAFSVESEFGEVEARDFTKLFDDDAPSASYGLKMTLDEEEEKPVEKAVVKQDDRYERVARAAMAEREAQLRELEEEQARRNEAAFADQHLEINEDGVAGFGAREALSRFESEHVGTLTMSVAEARAAQLRELEEEQARRQAEAAAAQPSVVNPMADEAANEAEVEASKKLSIEEERAAQLRELEEAQARKMAEALSERHVLKLELDDEPDEPVMPESYQERVARLIAERQAAIREQALKEREEALRELEELKQQGPQKPVIEQLQLTPDAPTDPDEVVEKVAPEDMVIKGFAYTELDMIHDNTAEREELEEDFDLHAAMAQKAREEFEERLAAEKKEKSVQKSEDVDDLSDF